MVLILGEKTNKSILRKLQKSLSNKALDIVASTIEEYKFPSDSGNLDNISLLILLVNANILRQSKLIKLYNQLLERQVPVILYLTETLPTDLPTWFFLESHDYVDGTKANIEQGIKALATLVDEALPRSGSKPKSRGNRTLTIIGISALIVFLIVFGIKQFTSKQENPSQVRPKQIINNPEELLIGTWRLADYKDNIIRTGQELQDYIRTINQLKQQFEITFYPDHRFQRRGFTAQTETGYWDYDSQQKILNLSIDKTKPGDRLKVLTLNENQLIFEVATLTPDQGTIVVRFTLYRVK